jgi:hypothetical protein
VQGNPEAGNGEYRRFHQQQDSDQAQRAGTTIQTLARSREMIFSVISVFASCSSLRSLWLEGRQIDSPSSASRTAWILGFISAFNQYGLQSQGADVSEEKTLTN